MRAADLARALGARKSGTVYVAACPSCGYKGALSVSQRDGRVLIHCHVGCEQAAVLAALRANGLWHGNHDDGQACAPPRPAAHNDDTAAHTPWALALWQRSRPAEGTPVEAYLRARGLIGPIPAALRYLPDAKHGPTGLILPAMIAAVTRWLSCEVVAVHRTFLKADGSSKAPVEPAKMTLGPVSGGAAQLASAGPALNIAEGIETALSVQQATELPTWAALSAGGIESLVLPPNPLVSDVTIFADHDVNGRGQKAADKAASRWHAEGRRVRIALPPTPAADFNDMLRAADTAAGPG